MDQSLKIKLEENRSEIKAYSEKLEVLRRSL